MSKPKLDEFLMHYGVKRRSGRYPWGSGDSPYQHSGDFLSRVETLKKQGLSEKDIAKSLGFRSTTDYRMELKYSSHDRRELLRARAQALKEDGMNPTEIARAMGYANESSVRALLNPNTASHKNTARVTSDILKKELEKKRMLDVGEGVERELGISEPQLREAVYILEREGYNLYGVGVPQVNNKSKRTIVQVLTNPEVTYGEVYQNLGDIQPVKDYYSKDGGKTFQKLEYPASIDSSRVQIRYGDEGGLAKDGVIEIRPGVKDLSLGDSHYAQVRILVDGTHYLKGMAMYSDDMPDGVDITFNTNKKTGTPPEKVMKEIKHDDPDNPFGALIKANGQSYYDDPDGKYVDPETGKKQSLSPINKLKEEGDWDSMSRNLSSQFLSKQPLSLIKKQLDLTYADAEAEFDEIMSLENPTIKRQLLNDFANECDSATVHLKAAALPRQRTQVILPVEDLKETEIYAPNYKNGEMVSLVRFPHGGTFEIPQLVVNNNNPSAKKILGPDIVDAVGINPKVAERLSGADFDGDTVVVIPTNSKVRITSTKPLKGLEGFDAKSEYGYREGMKVMTKAETQKQMGVVSNLITDMTLRGAPESDIVKAVRHSMVVIDAEKHKLDYTRSEKDNDIATLKQRWQERVLEDGTVKTGGASTLISRKKQTIDVPERQGSPMIDPDTGKVTYKESGRTYVDKKTGETKLATTKVKLMNYVDDTHVLSSGHPKEEAYADYANRMKGLADKARVALKNTGKLERNSSATEKYRAEVDKLMADLNVAAMNAPRERSAQIIANSIVKAKVQSNPGLLKDKKELKKVGHLALQDARSSVGAGSKEKRITITPTQWEAIQAGAISDTKLTQILRYADKDVVRQMAMPKATTQLSQAKINRIKAYSNSGYTNAQIAEQMGVSVSTVSQYLKS